mgnify:CR=1 FL=1
MTGHWMTLVWILTLFVIFDILGFYTFILLNVYAMVLFILMFFAIIYFFSAKVYKRR